MKTIALTGHPTAQAAVALQLRALAQAEPLELRVLTGLTLRPQAYGVHHGGGEVWHCGPQAPLRDLVGVVDRVVPGTTFEEIAPQVLECLQQMLTKINLPGETA